MRDEERRQLERATKEGDRDAILALAIDDERQDGFSASKFDQELTAALKWANGKRKSGTFEIDTVYERLCYGERRGTMIPGNLSNRSEVYATVVHIYYINIPGQEDAFAISVMLHNGFGEYKRQGEQRGPVFRTVHASISILDRWCLLRGAGLL